MARDVRQQVTVAVTTKVNDTLTPGIMKTAMQAASKEAVRLWQQRTVDGYGANGGRLRQLRPSTIKRKERILRGRAPSGRFAMSDPRQVARETGRTLREMQATSVRAGKVSNGISGGFQVSFSSARSRKVAGYLEDQGRGIVGFAPPSTARGRKERSLIMEIIGTVLRSKLGSGTITDRPA